MRKTVLLGLGTAIALATAAAAVAAVYTASGISSTTTTTFATTKAEGDVKSRTCTGADGKTFTVTDGRYTGTADFTNPATELDGPLLIHARTTVESGSVAKLGYVEGSFRVRDDDSRLSGKFWGTLDGTGKLSGFLSGSSHGHHARVLGTLTGTFSTATGLTGTLGGGTVAPLAVVVGPVCRGEKPKPPKPAPKPKLQRVEGSVSAVGDGSAGSTITVMTKGPQYAMCTRDATSPATTGFTVGTRVEMKCEYIGTTWTLRELKKHT